MEVGTQAMDHLINILQTDRYVSLIFVFLFGQVSVMSGAFLPIIIKKCVLEVFCLTQHIDITMFC